ncbi:unnamed protein product, partial [Iphiclides podalirius]
MPISGSTLCTVRRYGDGDDDAANNACDIGGKKGGYAPCIISGSPCCLRNHVPRMSGPHQPNETQWLRGDAHTSRSVALQTSHTQAQTCHLHAGLCKTWSLCTQCSLST